jgi:hypothetical protein
MKASEIKKMMISSLDAEADTTGFPEKTEEAGLEYDFSQSFTQKLTGRLFASGSIINRQVEFVKYMNLAFYRVALTGVAAIVILLLSIYFMEGSLSINSFLGVSDNYDESIICLLTGN